MSSASLLTSLLQYKAWANQELFTELQRLDPLTQHSELHAALRILNHIHVVERIFVANLQGIHHSYSATNTAETPTLAAMRDCVMRRRRSSTISSASQSG